MGGGILGKVLFGLAFIVLLYYIYQWMFGSNGLEGQTLLNAVVPANPTTAVVLDKSKFPAVFEGGEYSVNLWVYINDYSLNRGQAKHIVSIDGKDFSTLAIYLGPYKSSLHVRVHTSSTAGQLEMSSQASDTNLSTESMIAIFAPGSSAAAPFATTRPCDISDIDLQRWVQVTVTLNGKVVDVYIDGKLARSCILPTVFKVNGQDLSFTMADYGGFGGFMSAVSAYNYALNPEQVWRLYMSGPSQKYTIWEYLDKIFDPTVDISYPKYPTNG
jgi:hypothetical protein